MGGGIVGIVGEETGGRRGRRGRICLGREILVIRRKEGRWVERRGRRIGRKRSEIGRRNG